MVVNVDWFFLSHRLPLALKMKSLGYRVYILARDTGRKSEIIDKGLHFVEIPFARSGRNPLNEIRTIRRLASLFKEHQPEIIHNVTIKPAIYASIAAKIVKLKNTQVVNAISGLGYNFINERNGFLQKIVKWLMKYAYSGNVKFIFQNPDDKALYENMGFLKGNYRIIKGAGVDTQEYPFTPITLKEKTTVVTTARMLADKGIRELIQAAYLLKEKFKGKVLFQLIGDIDPENPSALTEEELKNACIKDYLEWKGHNKDVRPVLIESDIVCLPSYREGLPKSLIEAMAIGRAIITTDVPGCRECVEEGRNGFLVPPKDAEALAEALERLILDKELRTRMGKASREKMVEELSLEKVLEETITFYEC